MKVWHVTRQDEDWQIRWSGFHQSFETAKEGARSDYQNLLDGSPDNNDWQWSFDVDDKAYWAAIGPYVYQIEEVELKS